MMPDEAMAMLAIDDDLDDERWILQVLCYAVI